MKKEIWVEFKRKKSLVSEPKICWKFVMLDSMENSRYDRLNHLIVTQDKIPKKIFMKLIDASFGNYYKQLNNDKYHDISVQCYLSHDEIIDLIDTVEGEVNGVTA